MAHRPRSGRGPPSRSCRTRRSLRRRADYDEEGGRDVPADTRRRVDGVRGTVEFDFNLAVNPQHEVEHVVEILVVVRNYQTARR